MSRSEHNYPPTLRELIVNMVEGIGKHGKVTPIRANHGSPNSLVLLPSPALGSGKSENIEDKARNEQPAKCGRPLALSLAEKYVLGSWALEQVRKHKVFNIHSVQVFLKVISRIFADLTSSTFFQIISARRIFRSMLVIHTCRT